jgi:phospholipase C
MSMDKIEHVVLLMMENRSFDSLLGWLYDDKRPPAKHIPALKTGQRAYEGLSDIRRQEYENVDASGSIKTMPTKERKGSVCRISLRERSSSK